MLKRYLSGLVSTVLVTLVICGISGAQDDKEALKRELMDVREKKAMALVEMNQSMHDIKAQSEEDLAKIKETYRIAHNGCMVDKQRKEKELRKDYESKMSMLNEEEARLIKLVGSNARDNFAKTRTDKYSSN